MKINLNLDSIEDYRTFIKIKSLPTYRFSGRIAWIPDEYASRIGATVQHAEFAKYDSPDWMFDYQQDITAMAIEKQKFAVFADCGLGKTPILLAFAKHAEQVTGKRILIVTPLNVVGQMVDESKRFFGWAPEIITSKTLQNWLVGDGPAVGIVNYDAMKPELTRGNLGGLILDESSMLKSHYGKWGQVCIDLGRGLNWKLCCTGTPAPNDRIEYANHAVFLDQVPTVNSFLATYFVNRGQTQNRWELKPHALRPFYRSLSHWCIFLTDPTVYGWKDNSESLPPINVHIHEVPLTESQKNAVQKLTGDLFFTQAGGITNRSKLSQISKGTKGHDTNKPGFVCDLVRSFECESSIVWCQFNAEQDELASMMPKSASIDGSSKQDRRTELIREFQRGERTELISKPKILGFGLNLQIATRQVFAGLSDSYESYYQAVKRSNRYGSTKPLNVHLPVTEIEWPMVENVLKKADRVDSDAKEQEQLFRSMWKKG